MTQNNKHRKKKTQETITKTSPSLPKGTNFINTRFNLSSYNVYIYNETTDQIKNKAKLLKQSY